MQENDNSSEESADVGESGQGASPGRRTRFSPLNFLVGFGIGAFVGVGLALLAIAVADEEKPAANAVTSMEPDLPAVSGTVQPTPEARTKTLSALDVHLGPGTGFAVVGVLPKGETVEVVGRDSDSSWLAIRFPPGSSGRGWIPVSEVESPPDLSRLAVALPTPIPRTISTPRPADIGADGAPLFTPTPPPAGGRAATATAAPGLPDLVVVSAKVLPDRRVSVTVGNRGPGDVVGFTIFAQVRDLVGESELMNAPVPSFRAGATLTLETTTFRINGEQTVIVTVDPFGSAPDADRSNNAVRVVLAAPVVATPTP